MQTGVTYRNIGDRMLDGCRRSLAAVAEQIASSGVERGSCVRVRGEIKDAFATGL